VKDESDAFLECAALAHALLRLGCGESGCEKRQTFNLLSAAAFARRALPGASHKPRRSWWTMSPPDVPVHR